MRYTWLPGDGRKFNVNEPFGWYVEQGWSYEDNGTYVVSVIVTDRLGAADTASTTVTVVNAPPVAWAPLPPQQQAIGIPARAQFGFADSGSQDTHTIAIGWGDGTRDSITAFSERWNITMMHTYATPGSYWVEATVRDDDGGVGLARATYPVLVFDATEHRSVAGYDVFDIGTLGGNGARPQDFNDYRQIVGSSLTASGNYEAFLWDNGTLRGLGTLGRLNSEAQKINNAGAIAGVVWSRPGDYQYEVSMPATWRNGAGALLTNSSFNQAATAMAMNESGDVAWAAHGHEDPYAWVSRGDQWQRMGALLHPLGSAYGTGINEHGQITGSSEAVSTDDSPWRRWHAFVWEAGIMRDLGLLGFLPCQSQPDSNCGRAFATSINERGHVAGFSTAADGAHHAVVWADGTIKDLWALPPVFGWYNPFAVVNDRGYVAGSAGGEAFFWRGGALRPLGSLGGGGTEVVDMNEAGMVVGTSMTAAGEQHVFVWTQERGMVDLGTGPHGFTGAWVTGISYDGDIVGYTAPCTLNYYRACNFPSQPRAIMWRRLTP